MAPSLLFEAWDGGEEGRPSRSRRGVLAMAWGPWRGGLPPVIHTVL